MHNNPINWIDPSGHWDEKYANNWVINASKQQWSKASTKGERDAWASYADGIRTAMRQSGISESDIMQLSDNMLSETEVDKRVRDAHPILSAIADFTGAAKEYFEAGSPGAALEAMSASMAARGLSKAGTFEKELNFTLTTAKRMEQAGRYVPLQILQSTIKFGQEMPDPARYSSKNVLHSDV